MACSYTPFNQSPKKRSSSFQYPPEASRKSPFYTEKPQRQLFQDTPIVATDKVYENVNMSPYFVKCLKNDSNSRKKFAALLVEIVFHFTGDERTGYNCRGTTGKKPLDPIQMDNIQRIVYYHCPLKQGDNQDVDWKEYALKPSMRNCVAKKRFFEELS